MVVTYLPLFLSIHAMGLMKNLQPKKTVSFVGAMMLHGLITLLYEYLVDSIQIFYSMTYNSPFFICLTAYSTGPGCYCQEG